MWRYYCIARIVLLWCAVGTWLASEARIHCQLESSDKLLCWKERSAFLFWNSFITTFEHSGLLYLLWNAKTLSFRIYPKKFSDAKVLSSSWFNNRTFPLNSSLRLKVWTIHFKTKLAQGIKIGNFAKTLVFMSTFKLKSLYLLLRPDAHVLNAYVCGATVLATGVFLNHRVWLTNCNHVACLMEQEGGTVDSWAIKEACWCHEGSRITALMIHTSHEFTKVTVVACVLVRLQDFRGSNSVAQLHESVAGDSGGRGACFRSRWSEWSSWSVHGVHVTASHSRHDVHLRTHWRMSLRINVFCLFT